MKWGLCLHPNMMDQTLVHQSKYFTTSVCCVYVCNHMQPTHPPVLQKVLLLCSPLHIALPMTTPPAPPPLATDQSECPIFPLHMPLHMKSMGRQTSSLVQWRALEWEHLPSLFHLRLRHPALTSQSKARTVPAECIIGFHTSPLPPHTLSSHHSKGEHVSRRTNEPSLTVFWSHVDQGAHNSGSVGSERRWEETNHTKVT